jgi:hypothetical protein
VTGIREGTQPPQWFNTTIMCTPCVCCVDLVSPAPPPPFYLTGWTCVCCWALCPPPPSNQLHAGQLALLVPTCPNTKSTGWGGGVMAITDEYIFEAPPPPAPPAPAPQHSCRYVHTPASFCYFLVPGPPPPTQTVSVINLMITPFCACGVGCSDEKAGTHFWSAAASCVVAPTGCAQGWVGTT